MVKVMVAKANELGIQILYNTTGTKILTDSQNRVTGVEAKNGNGETIRINAKAVVIATGGFANDEEMIKKYTGFDLGVNLFPVGNAKKFGEGIKMAVAVGAATEGLEVLQLMMDVAGPGLKPFNNIASAATQPYLWVNQFGERFCDEGIGQNWPLAGNAIARQKNKFAYAIFDENTKKYVVEKGIDKGRGVYVPPTTRLTNLDKDIEAALEAGNKNIFITQSLEKMATEMGIDPNALLKTVKEYNYFCDTNYDRLFNKERKYLHPIKQPTFYGFRLNVKFLGTLGGIKINHRTEVLNDKDEAILGLYAVGNCAGGMYGDSYDLWSTGGTMGFAINSGRIAGENALMYMKH